MNRRTLETDHRRLAALVHPGMAVLDVGCGTGAITAGIAAKVGPAGRVLGIDRDDSLLAMARRDHVAANLDFERADIVDLTLGTGFDIVTAARTLQWITQPERAVGAMVRAVKAGGLVVVLDYNHTHNSWTPCPPPEFTKFYGAFLAWRALNGWDNLMADHLSELFRSAGLLNVEVHMEDAIGGADAAMIWGHVMQTLGLQIVSAGLLSRLELSSAEAGYDHFVRTRLLEQNLQMRTVVGRR